MMTIKKIFLIAIAFYSVQIFSMEKTLDGVKFGLAKLRYKLNALVGQEFTSYFYFATCNEPFLMNMKLELEGNSSQLSKYVARRKIVIHSPSEKTQQEVTIYFTPLHQAIDQGSLECVKVLCQNKVDIGAIIKDSETIQPYDQSVESAYGMPVYNLESWHYKARNYKKENHVGISALDFAHELVQKSKEDDLVSPVTRQAIYSFLKAKAEKND